jgi:1-acyl-sn-glycerol-3-phosphate acyltransferase
MQNKNLPGRFSMMIRSAIFGAVVPIFTIFWSMVCVLSWPLPLRLRHPVVMTWTNSVVWLLKVICCIDYRIEGWDDIPKDRNGIVMSKHQSSWETFYLPGLFDRTAIILKRELLWVPFFGWGMAVIDPIMINRTDKASSMAQIISKGRKFLQQGRWVLVFPEGTRIPSGHIGRYRMGGARLAADTGYPVLPVAHNAGLYWPRRQFTKRPGTVHVVFGPLIESKGRTAEEVLSLTKDWIEQTMQRIDPDSYPNGVPKPFFRDGT